ncbi:isochorismatase family protein [Ruegeria sp. Ofav3-42]|uniref:isochorismatase family protein n=1 Tax=Ruegeria sp. Ofav3-42 TaxID=2917759 RepID=UPI001EF53063|nr:isochorismatase family protein [Ruegeria sp. Ofav3-42]MCG7522603.1 isochorismatase family protein [Ruegeria sp. Ofav3-42]
MKTALIVIDVQMALAHDDAAGAVRSCPEAAENIGRLLGHFRANGDKVIHVHHHGLDPDDPFHPDAPGARVQPFAAPQGDEPVIVKNVSSAFAGTSLETDLRAENIERVVICGATANHCAESAARAASSLGFDMVYASDAVWAYEATGPDGLSHSAEQIHSVTLANLQGEFGEVRSTETILNA